jgi:hypothetical protein
MVSVLSSIGQHAISVARILVHVRKYEKKRRSCMKSIAFVLVLVIAVLAIFTTDAYSGAGLVGRQTAPSAIQSQLGLKLTQQLPGTLSAGQLFQATIVDPLKFGQKGFSNMKPGNVVTLKLLDDQGRFSITSGGLSKSFAMDQAGLIKSVTAR